MQRENKNKHQTSAIMKGEVKDEGCSKKNKTDRKLFKKNNICKNTRIFTVTLTMTLPDKRQWKP